MKSIFDLNLIVFQNNNLRLNVPVFAVKVESLGVLKPASLLQFLTILRIDLLQKVEKRKTRKTRQLQFITFHNLGD